MTTVNSPKQGQLQKDNQLAQNIRNIYKVDRGTRNSLKPLKNVAVMNTTEIPEHADLINADINEEKELIIDSEERQCSPVN